MKEAAEETTQATIQSRNPATGDLLGDVPVMDEAEVRQRVQRARKGFESWSALTLSERLRRLGRLQDVLARDSRSIAGRIAAETGKPRHEALVTEVTATCDLIRTLRRTAPGILRARPVGTGFLKTKRAWKAYEPVGVVGVISPWNYPFTLSMAPVVTALAAGNTVVLKPSEVTPLVGQVIEDAFSSAGFPEGTLEVVTGAGGTGAALVGSSVDMIHFTGSTATGRRILAAAADSLTPVVMELGGKDPMIVCEDADLERAANGAVWAGFSNSGQICMSVERVYVPSPIHDEFVERVVARTRELRQGPELGDGNIDIGAMIAPSQIGIVEEHVEDAVGRGARVETGGVRRGDLAGDFFEPTVLTGVDHDMRIMREETFGPVLPIMRVRDEREAIRLANDTPYGLTASVWTRDKAKGRRIAAELRAGSVLINDHITAYGITELPFGGVGDSGFGRVHGPEGLLEFVEVKSYVEDRLGLPSEPFWFPGFDDPLELFARINGFLYRARWTDRIRSLFGSDR
ncbi:MAG: aldehyde dehydrogenase family protein [Actinobacteria bacterium ATB1]|nr:aldehyde dehydrogenase family protein [Actinobacteria bacterium ATB1]